MSVHGRRAHPHSPQHRSARLVGEPWRARSQRATGAGRWLALAVCVPVLAISLMLSWMAVRTMVAAHYSAAVNNDAMPAEAMLWHLRDAIAMRPDIASSWRQQADLELDFNPEAALASARRATELDGYDWQNWRSLGMAEYRLGELPAARRALEHAAQDSQGFAAHYELANFHLLLGDEAGFWAEMKHALAIAPASQAPIAVAACLRASGNDPQPLLAILPRQRPQLTLAIAGVLLDDSALAAAEQVWDRLTCPERLFPNCRSGLEAILGVVSRPPARRAGEVQAANHDRGGRAAFALRAWNTAVRQGYLRQERAQAGRVSDSQFQHSWPGFGFGWTASAAVKLLLISNVMPNPVVSVRLGGMEPDQGWLFEQLIALAPGQHYRVQMHSRWLGASDAQGIYLAFRGLDGRVLSQAPVALMPGWATTLLDFTPPPGTRLFYVACRYQRPLGQVPLRGELQTAEVSMRAEATP